MHDYSPFIFYHLEMKSDRREWLESIRMLIAANKELFFNHCEDEKYIYLFELINRHYNISCTDAQLPLYENCELCRHNLAQRIFHDIKILQNLPHAERMYLLAELNYSFKSFDAFRNIKFIDGVDGMMDFEKAVTEIDIQLKKELEELRQNMGRNAIPGMKIIIANCSAVECAKLIADFLNNCTDDDGAYIFNFSNTTLADWLSLVFYFVIGKQVTSNTMRDYVPSQKESRKSWNKPGLKR
jgi:hypothetical protein